MLFIDEVVITAKAGDGGNGCLAFRREKFVPRGGPSGGDGGHGGSVILKASTHHNTLLHFRFNPEHTAERGRHGEGSNRTGKDGTDIELPVPVGTVIYDAETDEQLFDFASPITFRITQLYASLMYKFPTASVANPAGSFSSAAVAGIHPR